MNRALLLLRAAPNRAFTPAEVRDRLRLNPYTTYTTLKRLVARGLIRRSGRACYHAGQLTPPDTALRFAQDLLDAVTNGTVTQNYLLWLRRAETLGIRTQP